MSRPPDEFRILHVDDDPQLLELSEKFLTQEDDRLIVETMTDPTHAAEAVSTGAYDAIISDYQMPKMTGLELLEAVRQSQVCEIPVVIFTGEGREEVASEALNLGADRYLQKGGDPTAQYALLADAIIHEIEHARAKNNLQESKAKYAGVYENAPLAFVIWNKDGDIVDWNEQAEAVFGWSRTEAIGSPLDELLLSTAETERLTQQLVIDGVSTDQVIETATKDGHRRCCHWYSTPLADERTVLSMILDISDARERKTRLQEYATAVEASDDSIYMLNTDGEYVFANSEHLSRLAVDGKIERAVEDELAGRKYADIHTGPDADQLTEIIQEVLDSGESKTEEYAFETKDTWSYRTYSPVFDPEGDEPLGVVVISKDITQRKRLEEREAFLSSLLHHDVKNKIHTADGYLELLNTVDSADSDDYLETARRALADSMTLIEQVGTLSQLGHQELDSRNIQTVLEDVLNSYDSQAATAGVDIQYTGCAGTVRAGPLLDALFSNLIDNALTHANADTLTVRCREEGDQYLVVIEDDGNGLPTETATQLLEQGVSAGETAGTGLGLYLVAEIADSYGGSISLEESSTGGLRVEVRLQAA